MIKFKEFILDEDISDKEIDDIIESLTWEDIIDLYEDDELVLDEALTNTERIRKGQKMRSRKAMLALARKVKLKRASSTDVLTRRSKTSARTLMYKKLLKGRHKSQLSAAEKSAVEARVSKLLAMNKNLSARLMPKVKQLERTRLQRAGKR